LEATEKILAFDKTTRIVAHTANVMSDDREIYKKSGICDYLGKPFTSHELWHCLLKYLTPIGHKAGTSYVEDEEMQNELKADFLKENQNTFSEIVNAMESGDIKLAHRLVHTLKGTAGLTGKTALQNAAFAVEKKLRNGKNETTEGEIRVLKEELERALTE
jgi:HPt (histidine-containing phosphotransfer) domain-containing protein